MKFQPIILHVTLPLESEGATREEIEREVDAALRAGLSHDETPTLIGGAFQVGSGDMRVVEVPGSDTLVGPFAGDEGVAAFASKLGTDPARTWEIVSPDRALETA